MTGRVAVVGGGLAGLTAALRCADAGREVVLLEAAPRLGGLTSSFVRGDLTLDNGQHVFLRCCTRYRALLARLGVQDRVTLQPRLDVRVVEPGGRTHRLRRQRLPAPLHLGAALLRFGALPLDARLGVVRAAWALRRVDAADPRNDARSFGDWLVEHGQGARSVEALWDLFGVATLNAPAAQASLALAATVFQQGLLTDSGAGDIGWSLVPLAALHAEPAAAALAALGATVRTGARVESLQACAGGWRVGVRDADPIDVTDVVLAVPPGSAEHLLPQGALSLPDCWAARLGTSPIVNVHVVYDREVQAVPFFAAVGSPVQWVFDRTAQVGLRSGQCLAVSLSAADDLVDLPVARLREVVEPALADLLPRARQATVRDVFVTRERAATFRPGPGSAALRPGARTELPGLVLAGTWTDTGWPATMEGAVRSGEAAAAVVLSPSSAASQIAGAAA